MEKYSSKLLLSQDGNMKLGMQVGIIKSIVLPGLNKIDQKAWLQMLETKNSILEKM